MEGVAHPTHQEPATAHVEPKKEDITLDAAKVKKYLPYIILGALLVLGFFLRAYHLGYPAIGYHNWKEVHYLTEARNFARDGFFEHGFFVPAWDIPYPNEDLAGAHADTFPTISILGSIVYTIFGDNLAALRSIGVILNLASIVLLYFIVKRLFKREDLALTTAALAALNPLMIFFTRNFQLDSPALFFMLLGTWFYIAWIEHDKRRDFLLAAAFTTFGILTKYSFVVMALPFLFMFPYKRLLEWKPRIKTFAPAAGFVVIFLIWFWYMESYFKGKIRAMYNLVNGGAVISLSEIINFTVVFTRDFWNVMLPFIYDNFTKWGIAFAIVGLLLLALMWKKYALGGKYFLTYAGTGLLFFVILAFKLSGHSYHQFPYAPLIIFLTAFAFVVIGATIGGLVKFAHVKWVVIVLLVLLLWPGQWGIKGSLDRQFGVVFPGLDVAGEFIKANSEPWERMFHSSQQNYGVIWHSDRKGYKFPSNLEGMLDGESKNVTWLFIYQWRFDVFQNEELMKHIRANYQLRQMGFIMQGTQYAPYYFLFQKGGTYDETQLNQMLNGQPIGTKNYELPNGNLAFNYITLPRQVEPIPEPIFNMSASQ